MVENSPYGAAPLRGSPMPYATVNGIRLAYSEQGTGLPVVFLHGFPLNREMWTPQRQGLSDRARIVSVDLRGHGDSACLRAVGSAWRARAGADGARCTRPTPGMQTL